jgi:hypothetical protein
MPGIDGGTLRAWRRSRGWDVPEVARQLRYAARESAIHVAAPAIRRDAEQFASRIGAAR